MRRYHRKCIRDFINTGFKDLILVVLLLTSLSGFTASGQNKGEWPCFHGANRQNKSAETPLNTWPAAGPNFYTPFGLGEGYSSVSIVRWTDFTQEGSNQSYIFAFGPERKLYGKSQRGAGR
jgi:hypothetical protein